MVAVRQRNVPDMMPDLPKLTEGAFISPTISPWMKIWLEECKLPSNNTPSAITEETEGVEFTGLSFSMDGLLACSWGAESSDCGASPKTFFLKELLPNIAQSSQSQGVYDAALVMNLVVEMAACRHAGIPRIA